MDCLFCKIIKGEVPSQKVFENDYVYAFKDIDPQAATHILVLPKEHIVDSHAINETNVNYINEIFLAIPKIADDQGLEKGYRVVSNVGEHGQQSIPHLHFHIIGGEQLIWQFT